MGNIQIQASGNIQIQASAHNKWAMLAWLLLVQLFVAFVGRSIGPLAPFFEKDFAISKAEIGMMTAALFLGQSIASIPAGWYADRLGTRKMMLLIAVVLGGAFLAVSFVPWYPIALLFVVVGGLSYGAMHPTSNRGIISWFPRQLAGTAMGIKQMGVTGGSALAALVLIPAATLFGWRLALGISTVLLFVVGLLAYRFYRDFPIEMAGGASAQRPNFFQSLKLLLAHKPLLLLSVAAMGLTSAQLSLTTYLVLYVSDFLLLSAVVAGSFLALSEVGGSLGRVAWGIISDRFFRGRRIPVLVLIAVLTAGCGVVFASFQPGVHVGLLVAITLFFGFCVAGFNGIWMNAAAESVDSRLAGMASGFSLSIGSWGIIFGPPVFGWIVDVTGGYKWAWLFVTGQMMFVVVLLWMAGALMKKTAKHETGIDH